MLKIKIKKLYKDSKLPIKGSEKAACWDVYCHSMEVKENGKVYCKIGLAMQPPEGYKIVIVPRSNLTKHYWIINNSPIQGDEDYTGEYQIRFTPLLEKTNFPYKVGERIAQMYIEKVNNFEFEEVNELDQTERGSGGFGSSGLK